MVEIILEQMRDAVRIRLGVPENEGFYTAQQLDSLINEALQTISVENAWPWLQVATTFPTVANTRFYTPPSNWQRTKALSIDGYDALTFLDLQEIRNWPDSVTDVPMFYTIYQEQIYLAPTPSAVYTIRHDYIRQENKLLDDTDAPVMPVQFQYSILSFAAHLAHLRAGDLPRAQAAMAEYSAWKKRMEEARPRSSSTIKVRVRPGREI